MLGDWDRPPGRRSHSPGSLRESDWIKRAREERGRGACVNEEERGSVLSLTRWCDLSIMGCRVCTLQKPPEQYKLLYEVCQVTTLFVSYKTCLMLVSEIQTRTSDNVWTYDFYWVGCSGFFGWCKYLFHFGCFGILCWLSGLEMWIDLMCFLTQAIFGDKCHCRGPDVVLMGLN